MRFLKIQCFKYLYVHAKTTQGQYSTEDFCVLDEKSTYETFLDKDEVAQVRFTTARRLKREYHATAKRGNYDTEYYVYHYIGEFDKPVVIQPGSIDTVADTVPIAVITVKHGVAHGRGINGVDFDYVLNVVGDESVERVRNLVKN